MFVVSFGGVNIKVFDKPTQESRCYVHFDGMIHHELTYMVNDLKLFSKDSVRHSFLLLSPAKVHQNNRH